jgi:hypothetical protein
MSKSHSIQKFSLASVTENARHKERGLGIQHPCCVVPGRQPRQSHISHRGWILYYPRTKSTPTAQCLDRENIRAG